MRSTSVRQVAVALGCNYTGGGYAALLAGADDLGLPRDHMTGKAWNRGEQYRDPSPGRPLDEWLQCGTVINSSKLKAKLFSAGVKARRCERCGITEWQGEPAPLALDHINGDTCDNRLINLRILCYNCHGLTPTFCRPKRRGSVPQRQRDGAQTPASVGSTPT